jgi:glycosyltransferase involved in cell wall biosynthesis
MRSPHVAQESQDFASILEESSVSWPGPEAGQRKFAPLVTIAIPAFNRPGLLAETLASIAAQTARLPFEVIVCDDGLMPETREVVERFRGNGFIYLPNPVMLGAVGNWNRCLEMATGDWVMILHEDDTLYPWYLECILPRLFNGTIAVCTRTSRGVTPPHARRPQGIAHVTEYLPRYFLKSSMTPFPGVMMRRDVALRLGGFDEAWGPIADYEFWYRLACAGRVEVVSTVGAFYRVAPGQWTERIWHRMLRLTHLLRLRIAREQFPGSRRLGRWTARFFTSRNARRYGMRFGSGTSVLRRCLQMGAMPAARLPAGWVWQALKFASRGDRRHLGAHADAGRAAQIQQDSRGPHRLAEAAPVGGPARHAPPSVAGARRAHRHAEGEAWDRYPHKGADDPRQVA